MDISIVYLLVGYWHSDLFLCRDMDVSFGWSSSSSDVSLCEEDELELFVFLKHHAHPDTNIVTLDQGLTQTLYWKIVDRTECDFWDANGALGPECNLCNEEITSDRQKITISGVQFTLVFSDELESMDEDSGFLQCVYCLNFYHRHNCSLTMSDSSYLSSVKHCTWSCPNCVPEFVHSNSNAKVVNKFNTSKLLLKLAKILSPVLDEVLDLFATMSDCEIKEVMTSIVKFMLMYDIG